MQRLRGSDAQTIYTETPTSPFVTLKVMIYESTDPNVPPDVNELEAFIKSSISGWLRRGLGFRVIRVPFDLHHPVWVEDKNFRLGEHIHRLALPSPGNKEMLSRMISYAMSMPLDPNRPLWDSWIVEGLEGGRIAWICKMHHVLGDGIMSAKNLTDMHEPNIQPVKDCPLVPIKPADDIPTDMQLVLSAITDVVKSYTTEFPTYYKEYKQAKAARKALKEPIVDAYGPFMAPHTSLNLAGGSYRNYLYETFSLAEFKSLSRQLDCTINDLVLGLCSEALRHYLADIEPLPETPLVIVMPVSNRGTDVHQKFLNSDILNNSVSIAFVPLDLNIENFFERLKTIKQGSRNAIEHIRQTRGTRIENIYDFLPGVFFRLINWVMARRQAKKQQPFANVSISNVPGPREPLFACNGKIKMVDLLSCGNLVDTNSVGITVWSYLDHLNFSCLFRKGTAPEPAKFTAYLRTAYDTVKTELSQESSKVKAINTP